MKRIGLLSDTHGFLDPKVLTYFADVDEVWHAGDIGDLPTLEALEQFKPLRIVYGNIDDHRLRAACKEFLRFKIEDVNVLMTHIAGRPGKYAKPALAELLQNGAPQLFAVILISLWHSLTSVSICCGSTLGHVATKAFIRSRQFLGSALQVQKFTI